jgi:hypothetical protein
MKIQIEENTADDEFYEQLKFGIGTIADVISAIYGMTELN